jgi:hypothetical protein
MESRFISIIALAGTLALPFAASAADTPPASPTAPKASTSPSSPPPTTAGAASSSFKALDSNKDGFISRDEAKSSDALNKRFSQLDLDRDGKLSQTEMNAVGSPAAGGSQPGSSTKAPK